MKCTAHHSELRLRKKNHSRNTHTADCGTAVTSNFDTVRLSRDGMQLGQQSPRNEVRFEPLGRPRLPTSTSPPAVLLSPSSQSRRRPRRSITLRRCRWRYRSRCRCLSPPISCATHIPAQDFCTISNLLSQGHVPVLSLVKAS